MMVNTQPRIHNITLVHRMNIRQMSAVEDLARATAMVEMATRYCCQAQNVMGQSKRGLSCWEDRSVALQRAQDVSNDAYAELLKMFDDAAQGRVKAVADRYDAIARMVEIVTDHARDAGLYVGQ